MRRQNAKRKTGNQMAQQDNDTLKLQSVTNGAGLKGSGPMDGFMWRETR
jgi:hypothetical protein